MSALLEDVDRPTTGRAPRGNAMSPVLRRLISSNVKSREVHSGPVWSILRVVLAVACALTLWTLAALAVDSSMLFPSPLETGRTFVDLVKTGEVGGAISVSGFRILAGFLIGSALGIVVGFLSAESRVTAAVVDPFLHFLRFIPPIVWFGPMLLFFGTGELSKIMLVVYTTFFVVAITTTAGVHSVPRDAIRASATFGASRLTTLRRVILPGSAGHIFVGMRVAMANSFMTIVVAEMLGANEGIGYLITNGTLTVDTSVVFVGVTILGVGGLALDWLFSTLAKRFGDSYLSTAR